MIIKKGIGANIGIAIGKAYLIKEDSVLIERTELPKDKIKGEIKRFKEAIVKTKEELNVIREQILNSLGKNHAKLIDAHHMILMDPLITKEVPEHISSFCVNAEFALSEKISFTLKKFENIEDPFFAERKNEIMDVAKRIMSNLSNEKKMEIKDLKEPSIIVAHNIYPSDTLQIRKSDKVMAFCMDVGSKSSHTAIFAQSIGIPAVVGLGDISRIVKQGDLLIINGEDGTVTIDPLPEMVEAAKVKMNELKKKESYLLKMKNLPTATRDSKKINLMVNLDPQDDIQDFKSHNTDGVGLFRTEFLYMNRTSIPNEEEQYEVYKKVLSCEAKLPITIRTADIGADKASNIGIKGIKNEENPFMGFRGIRLFLKYPDLMKTQLKAILRASPSTQAQIMLPMITSIEEIVTAKKIISEAKNELAEKGIPFKEDIPVGIMVEVPAAALMLDQFLNEIDFVSIGTNDLVQYILAVDRVNQYVSELYDPYHPSVIRVLNLIIQTAHKKGKKVSVCGEMASDTYGCAALISLGADSLSVPLKMHLKVKEFIRNTNYEKLVGLRQRLLNMQASQEILDIFKGI
ncbi:MAG: phosphoenolpyruvate--protein phosphotransferase [Elusimicrobiota bacterium]